MHHDTCSHTWYHGRTIARCYASMQTNTMAMSSTRTLDRCGIALRTLTPMSDGIPQSYRAEHQDTYAPGVPQHASRSIYDAALLCHVEPWMHEVEETSPHSIPSTISSGDVIGSPSRWWTWIPGMASPYHQYSRALVVLWIARSTTTLLLHALHSRRAACVVRYFGTV